MKVRIRVSDDIGSEWLGKIASNKKAGFNLHAHNLIMKSDMAIEMYKNAQHATIVCISDFSGIDRVQVMSDALRDFY